MSKHLLRSTAITGSMTLLSRILGFIRDMVVARVFGATIAADAFFVAFKIPNFLRRLFAEGAFSQAFVPVLSEYKAKEGQVKILADNVAGMLGIILLGVTVLGVVAAPIVIMVFAPGYIGAEDGRYDLAVGMLRITFPYLFFISLTAVGGAILNTWSRFAVPAFAPVLLNLSMIGAAIWLAPMLETPIYALAWGVFIGGILQLLWMLPFLKQIKMLPRPKIDRQHQGVRRILKLMVPALFGVSVSQINLLLDVVIASFLTVGSVSWLYYADRLMEFPLGVFGIAIATVVLPSLSKDHALSKAQDFTAKIDWSLRLVLLGALPAAIGLFLLAEPMLITLFQYGEFGVKDVAMAGWALKAYSFGLLAFILIKVLANGFYARQDTKTPVKIGIIAMAVNMGLNLIFVLTLINFEFVAPHMGLAMATTVSAIVNAYLLYKGLRRSEVYKPQAGWVIYISKILMASALMILTVWWLSPTSDIWLEFTAIQRVVKLATVVICAASIYLIGLWMMRVKFWQIKS